MPSKKFIQQSLWLKLKNFSTPRFWVFSVRAQRTCWARLTCTEGQDRVRRSASHCTRRPAPPHFPPLHYRRPRQPCRRLFLFFFLLFLHGRRRRRQGIQGVFAFVLGDPRSGVGSDRGLETAGRQLRRSVHSGRRRAAEAWAPALARGGEAGVAAGAGLLFA